MRFRKFEKSPKSWHDSKYGLATILKNIKTSTCETASSGCPENKDVQQIAPAGQRLWAQTELKCSFERAIFRKNAFLKEHFWEERIGQSAFGVRTFQE
jgi:hypothetical protein